MVKLNGKVYLVGAGPGDPELLTIKGRRLLQEAEVVIYDRLVGEEILDLINPEAERLFVGKSSTYHSRPQAEINAEILRSASEGKKVVRLKGGDPYIFGRGSEEAFFLKEAGIAFEVVPGVTAASGASTYAGIPLTDRRCATSVTFVTGHRMKGRGLEDINWPALTATGGTLVFYMALTNLAEITAKLMESGMAPDKDAAVVKSATMAEQTVVVSRLELIAAEVEASKLEPPALLIVGDVVGLQERLTWFDPEP